MTAITSGSTSAGARRPVDVGSIRATATPVAAVVLAILVLVAGWAAASRVVFLLGWDSTFSATGEFTVVACAPQEAFGADRWSCFGRLTSAAGEREATLVVGKDARMSSRPYVGQRVDVFYAPPSAGERTGAEVVYADDAQLSELTRLYLALLPLLMVVIGGAGWLLGFLLGRLGARSSNPDSWWRTSALFADLQRRGTIWLLVGLGSFVAHYLIVRYVLGSAGVG